MTTSRKHKYWSFEEKKIGRQLPIFDRFAKFSSKKLIFKKNRAKKVILHQYTDFNVQKVVILEDPGKSGRGQICFIWGLPSVGTLQCFKKIRGGI